MSPVLILTCVAIYTIILFTVTYFTSRGADNKSFFIGNRSSKWYVVAYGMIGASLSGVTFMSVPGDVGKGGGSYFQMVLGYLLGYFVISYVLLPLYYRLNVTSIYSYLKTRLGIYSYKTGSLFFIISRTIGAAFRLFIVVNVLQIFVFDAWGIHFAVTTGIFILLIIAYTLKGGVKTIIWTDSLQTTFMLLSLLLSVFLICKQLDFSFSDMITAIKSSSYSNTIISDWHARAFFPKHFFGGMFIAIAMTGLDQEMMQKNISCKNIGEAQKNVMTFSLVLVLVNFIFLCLGALLYIYISAKGITIPERTTDDLFPTVALSYLGTASAIFFIIGLISAAYPSADGALTALTASFCIDFLNFETGNLSEERKTALRKIIHVGFAILLLAVIVVFRVINNEAVIRQLFRVANYTYGPLLGLFFFGILTSRTVKDRFVPVMCLLSPAICYLIDTHSMELLNGYLFGNELLALNGLITFILLYSISNKKVSVN